MNSWKHLPDTSSAAAPPGSVIKMTLSPARCFILLLILSYVDAGRIFWEMKERVREVQLQRAEQLLLAKVSRGQQHFQHVKSGSLEQQLDHFNRQDSKTFRQKYLVNNKYWKKPDGPVFLYIGGEGPLNFVDVFFGHHVEMAKKHDALLVALEHRFYGKSINPDGLKMENLASLSSEQALVDLAVFHEHISQSFNLTRNNTWISFGGSYAGALSAWLKRKFPHLVFAAVASSAPVRAKLDFSAYCKRVGLGLLNERVGGSLKCFSEVQKAFAALEAALMAGDVCQVATDFNCCQEPTELDDQINLMQSLADIFMGTVQYNDEFMNINMICDVMTNKARDDEREGYGGLVRLSKMLFGARCLEVSLKNELNYLMNTTVGRGSYRQWIYQTCTEFGFCQSCEDAMCPFSRMISLKYQEKICQSVFGISPRSLNRHVAFSNTYYGGDCPTTHRVLYVNGEIDPWRELSVVEGCTVDGEKVHAVLIKDVAHCADMLSDQVDDRASLKSGRKEIENYVTDFLRTAEVEKLEKRCD